MTRIVYTSGYKYQLRYSYFCHTNITGYAVSIDYLALGTNGILYIDKGYAWDGPSGPTIDTKTFMRGSLVHDALYQLMRKKKLPPRFKAEADHLLRAMCLEDGMNPIRAWWVYEGVNWFGKNSTLPENAKVIEGAP